MLDIDTPVVAAFAARADAVEAINALLAAGFAADQIGYVSRESEPQSLRVAGSPELVAAPTGEPGDVAAGMMAGGMLGGVLAAGLALLVPGVGPVLAGGVLASFFGGTLAGSAVGGLLSAFTEFGISHDLAERYQAEFHAGATIVAVHAGTRTSDAEEILAEHGGTHIHREADPGNLAHPTSRSL